MSLPFNIRLCLPPLPPFAPNRAAALAALNQIILGALAPPDNTPAVMPPPPGTTPLIIGYPFQQSQPAPDTFAPASTPGPAPFAAEMAAPPGGGAGATAAAPTADGSPNRQAAVDGHEALQHMLLVALDSLYREDREADVRRGLLKIVVNLLQHHGDCLTRGWVPLLR